MSVRTQRERDAQFERERALLEMRHAVVSAVAPSYVRRVGSSAVFEAVDEALAQIVAAGGHLAEPDQVKALWITCAKRRLIDEHRSAESKHRDPSPVDETIEALADQLCGDLSQLTEDGRQRWRIREILSVLRGDQRRWAEAWYDEVLSGSRSSGAQPRGLPETLGWSPSKTKSVSRRARMKMAAFIEARSSGAVCEEQRALLDAFILAASPRHERQIDEEQYSAVLFHVAGCDDCWAAWHARRRTLLGRCRMLLILPIDGVAIAAHTLAGKAGALATGAHAQASSLLGRLGMGGAAAAGGGAATIGGKATAVCVGVVCAATAGGELAGVLPPITTEPAPQKLESAAHAKRVSPPTTTATAAARQAALKTISPTPPAVTAPAKAAVRKALTAARTTVVRSTPGDLPPASPSRAASTSPASTPPPPAAATAAPSATFSASGSSESGAPPAAAPLSSSDPTCVPGDLGC